MRHSGSIPKQAGALRDDSSPNIRADHHHCTISSTQRRNERNRRTPSVEGAALINRRADIRQYGAFGQQLARPR